MVYDDIFDAKNAVDHLNGFNVAGRYFFPLFLLIIVGRYLIVLYYQPTKMMKKPDLNIKKAELDKLKEKLNPE